MDKTGQEQPESFRKVAKLDRLGRVQNGQKSSFFEKIEIFQKCLKGRFMVKINAPWLNLQKLGQLVAKLRI